MKGKAPCGRRLGQFTIEWFDGNGPTTPLAAANVTGAAGQTAQNLDAGTYTVRVTDLVTPNNGCSTTTTFTITDTPAVVTIENADIVLTPQSNCSPVNGGATVNEITVNGAGIGNTTGYVFTWYASDGTTVVAGSGTAATIGVSLAAGNYFVQATNTTTNCKSPITNFTITDTHVNPAITAATTTNVLDPERVREAALAGDTVVFADSARREAIRWEGAQSEASLLEQVKREVDEEWAKMEKKIKDDVGKARKALKTQAQDFAKTLAAKIVGRELA